MGGTTSSESGSAGERRIIVGVTGGIACYKVAHVVSRLVQAGAVVTDFQGRPVTCSDNVESVYDVVASSNAALHETVLELIAACERA